MINFPALPNINMHYYYSKINNMNSLKAYFNPSNLSQIKLNPKSYYLKQILTLYFNNINWHYKIIKKP